MESSTKYKACSWQALLVQVIPITRCNNRSHGCNWYVAACDRILHDTAALISPKLDMLYFQCVVAYHFNNANLIYRSH